MFIWITWGIILLLYARVGWYIYQQAKTVAEYVSEEAKQQRDSRNRKVFFKLALFPLVGFMCSFLMHQVYFIQWFPATINRIQNAENPNHPDNNLFLVVLVLSSLTS